MGLFRSHGPLGEIHFGAILSPRTWIILVSVWVDMQTNFSFFILVLAFGTVGAIIPLAMVRVNAGYGKASIRSYM